MPADDRDLERQAVPFVREALTSKTLHFSIDEVQSRMRIGRPDWVALDYVQRMRLAARSQDKRNEINTIGYLLTDAIKESGAGGILFSQLTEDSSTGKLRARESEDLHNSAEVVLFGKSERTAKLDSSGKKQGDVNTRKLWVDKVKEGPAKFEIDLDWDADAARFVSDYADEDRQRALGIEQPPVDPTYDHLDDEHVA